MGKPKIALIGPIHPYRSGIAHYTESLAEAFNKTADLKIISFKRLYPRFLFPGKSDKVDNPDESKTEGVDYIIDVYSPRSWVKTASSVADNECDVAVIAWWTFFWQPMLGFIAWRLKRKGVKVFYLCHNITDHEENWIKRQISKAAIRIADGYIVHSREEADKLKGFKQDAKVLTRVHPIYTRFPKPSEKLKKRGKLEVLYFGFIRPYKGVDILLKAMDKLNDKDIYFTIVGEVWGANYKQKLASHIEKSKKDGVNIEYDFEYVDEVKAANYFSRADVVVLPYLSATGSGVLTIAYNCNKPVVASAVGGLVDTVINNETGWLIKHGSPKELAQAIDKITRKKAESMRPNIKKFCQENSWDNMAAAIIDFTSKK